MKSKTNTVNLKELSRVISCLKYAESSVLAWIVSNKNDDNEVDARRMLEVSIALGVSPSAVYRVFTLLEASGFARLKHSGCYIISPDVMCLEENRLSIVSDWENAKEISNAE